MADFLMNREVMPVHPEEALLQGPDKHVARHGQGSHHRHSSFSSSSDADHDENGQGARVRGRKRELTPAETAKGFASFTSNVILSTVLFMLIFVSGSAWTMAVGKAFDGTRADLSPSPHTRYWVFATIMTLVTVLLSLVFGELARHVRIKTGGGGGGYDNGAAPSM